MRASSYRTAFCWRPRARIMLFVDRCARVLEDQYLEIISNFVTDNPVILLGTLWFGW